MAGIEDPSISLRKVDAVGVQRRGAEVEVRMTVGEEGSDDGDVSRGEEPLVGVPCCQVA